MSDQPRFVLNVNAGEDVIHRNPGEECNTDDAVDRSTIDRASANAMLKRGLARRCEHCSWENEDT